MPLYEFVCATCGPFEKRRPFAEASAPMTCPTCGASAKRVYTAPGIYRTPPSLGKAMDQAYKSGYEPQVVTREQPAHVEPTGSRMIQKRSGRPWQLGD